MNKPDPFRYDHEGELIISERWLKYHGVKMATPEYKLGDLFHYEPYGRVQVIRIFEYPLQQYGVQFMRGDRVRRATIDWERAPRRQ